MSTKKNVKKNLQKNAQKPVANTTQKTVAETSGVQGLLPGVEEKKAAEVLQLPVIEEIAPAVKEDKKVIVKEEKSMIKKDEKGVIVEEKKPAVKETAAKKAPAEEKKVAKKAPAPAKEDKKAEVPAKKGVVQNLYIQHNDNDFEYKDIFKRVKEAWVALGHKESEIKSVNVYVVPSHMRVYYVINEEAKEEYSFDL